MRKNVWRGDELIEDLGGFEGERTKNTKDKEERNKKRKERERGRGDFGRRYKDEQNKEKKERLKREHFERTTKRELGRRER